MDLGKNHCVSNVKSNYIVTLWPCDVIGGLNFLLNSKYMKCTPSWNFPKNTSRPATKTPKNAPHLRHRMVKKFMSLSAA